MSEKLIFFDIDGTLWDENMVVPESTIEALHGLRRAGYKIFICSGRAKSNICSPKILGIGFDGIVAACGCHIEMDGERLFEKILSPELTEYIVKVRGECRMPVVLEGPDYHWIDMKGFEEDPFVDYLFADLGERAVPLYDYQPDMRINKFSADILPDTDYGLFKEKIGADFDILEHEGNVIEMVPKGFSKATGIAWLCEHLGVDKADTYAVGDSVNDLDMLGFVGHSVAMGNASAAAKAAAEYVTSDIHEDGILRAMQNYGLLKK